MADNSGGSYHFVRPFDGSSDGKGHDNWRDMRCAESLGRGLDHVFDGLIPAVPEPTGDSAVEVRLKTRLKEAHLTDAKRMVGQFTKLCSGEPATIAHKYISECRAMDVPVYSVKALLDRWDYRYANRESRASKLVTLKLFLSVRQRSRGLAEYSAEFSRLVDKLANFASAENFSQPLMALLFIVGLHPGYKTFVQAAAIKMLLE